MANTKRPLLRLQNYTFSQTTSDTRYWNCSKKFSLLKCQARLRFDTEGNMVFHELRHNHDPPRYYKNKDGTCDYNSEVFGLVTKVKSLGKFEMEPEADYMGYNITQQYRKSKAIARRVLASIKPKKKRNPMYNVNPSAFVTTTLGDALRPSNEPDLLRPRFEEEEILPSAFLNLDMGDLTFEVIRVSKVKRPLLMVQKYTFVRTTSDFRYWNCSRKSRKCSARLRFDNRGHLVFSSLDHNHIPPLYYKQPNGLHVRRLKRKRKQTKEERLEKKRIAERRRMSKIKNDPDLYAQWKEKERQKYLKKKRLGKIVLVSDRNLTRNRSRESSKSYHQNKKQKKILDKQA